MVMMVRIAFADGRGTARGMSGGDCKKRGRRTQERFLEDDENTCNLRGSHYPSAQLDRQAISTRFMIRQSFRTPAAEVPTAAPPGPDLLLQARRLAQLFPPCGALVSPLSLGAAVGELFRGRAWLALFFLLVRWHPPFYHETGFIFVCVLVH
jgi:hypothetical protein